MGYPHDFMPVHLERIGELLNLLAELAWTEAKKVPIRRSARRRRPGAVRRPGPDTPLWNAVVAEMTPFMRKYGAQANLGRVLGVPRQRVHDYFVRRTQMPDAERVIHLLLWLAASAEPPGRRYRQAPVSLV